MVLPGIKTSRIAAADTHSNAFDAFQQQNDGRGNNNVEALCADLDVIWIAPPNQFHCEPTVIAAVQGKKTLRPS